MRRESPIFSSDAHVDMCKFWWQLTDSIDPWIILTFNTHFWIPIKGVGWLFSNASLPLLKTLQKDFDSKNGKITFLYEWGDATSEYFANGAACMNSRRYSRIICVSETSTTLFTTLYITSYTLQYLKFEIWNVLFF